MLEDFITSYPVMSNKELAERFKVSLNSIRRKGKELKLYKLPLYQRRIHTIETIKRMYDRHTAMDMAKETGVSKRTVYRICNQLNLKRGKQDKSRIYSEAAKKMIRLENSRKSFGLETCTLRFFGKSKQRSKKVKEFRRHGYIVISGNAEAYYSTTMTRNHELERNAETYGFRIVPWT